MEKTENKYWIINFINSNWSILAFSLSGISYLIGYIKSYYLLRTFRIYVTPTEIYSAPSLFVSGISTLFLGLTIPFLSLLLGVFIKKDKLSLWQKVTIFFLILIILQLLNKYFLGIVPLIIKCSILGYEAIPVMIMYFINTILIYSMVTYDFSIVQKRQLRIYLSLVIIWFLLFTVSYTSNLQQVRSGAKIGSISHDAGMEGTIITKYPVSTLSEKTNLDNKGYYLTSGMLINRNEQTYYFIPGIFAQTRHEDFPDTNLVIIPVSNVIEFYQTPR